VRKAFLVFFFLSLPAMAADIQVWGRQFTNSCSYYTLTWGDYDLTFRDTTLPWGTKVTAVVAFAGNRMVNGVPQLFSWDRSRYISMEAASAFTWRARKSEELHSRSHDTTFTRLQFIFKVEAPGRAAYFVNGGSSWGHYEVDLTRTTIPCVTSGGELPRMVQFPISVIDHK